MNDTAQEVDLNKVPTSTEAMNQEEGMVNPDGTPTVEATPEAAEGAEVKEPTEAEGGEVAEPTVDVEA